MCVALAATRTMRRGRGAVQRMLPGGAVSLCLPAVLGYSL